VKVDHLADIGDRDLFEVVLGDEAQHAFDFVEAADLPP